MTSTPTPAYDVALAEADALLDEGSVRPAVDALTAAYAIQASPELAHRIVHLRHRAVTPNAGGGRDAWPPVFADPFPDVVGLPEIDAHEITPDLLGGAILHHGGIIARGLVTPDRAEEIRSRVVDALSDRDRIEDADAEAVRPGDVVYQPFDEVAPTVASERAWVREVGGMLMADAPGIMVDLLDAFRSTGVADAVTGYLGERPALSYNKCVLRRLKESAPTWHQDGAFMGSEVRSVDLWLSLSHCGGDAPAPGLDLVPKRFDDILETGTKGSIFPNSIGQGVIDEVAADAPWVTPAFAPGDAILFDERFVHRSSVNGTFTEERYAVESWFFAPSHFPARYVPILV